MTDYDAYFDEVYERTYDDLLRYAVIKTNRADGVEDVLQTVYHKFWLRIQRHGYADIEQPKAFLISVAKKELWRRKRQKGAPTLELTQVAELHDEAEVDELAVSRVLAGEIWTLVKREPLLSYKCFVLYYGFDMPVRAIASELSISEEAVKSRLFRTRARVRARFLGQKEDVQA